MVRGRKNEGLEYSHQLQVPVPTSHPIQLIVGTPRVRSMDKVNAADRTQTYRYVLIPSLSVLDQLAGIIHGSRCCEEALLRWWT